METILVTGACGQLGTELTEELRIRRGTERVIATDINPPNEALKNGPFETLDVLDRSQLMEIIHKHNITRIYHLAAILSAAGEKHPIRTWDINMEGLLNVLEAARESNIKRIFWPSSIAVFGPTTPSVNTPQRTVMEPDTIYGISKLAGERWCEYYNIRYGLDVRSVRYPGLIGWKSLPGGGTTDYAVEIYHKAVENEPFSCFLKSDTCLPMMYMSDAIRATIELLQAPPEKISVRSSYNLSGMSFTPEEIAASIKQTIPEFNIEYAPDERQKIADNWPDSIDDSQARDDWGWKPEFDLKKMTKEMIERLSEKNQAAVPE